MTARGAQGAGTGRRRQGKRARAQRREEDRALVPVVVSQRLGVSVADAASAMRAAGVTGPLTVSQAREWAADPGSAPEWLSGLWGERMARAAQQEYHRERQREQQAVRELAVEQSALEKVKTGKRRFSDDEWLLVEDWAFEAAKDLVRGGLGGEVGDFDRRVLRVVGVDPEDHATWPVQAGGCDGEGAAHCAERIEQVRAGRRADALIESVARETALREAGFSPGQAVTVWHGQRVGVVVKVNKVSVKVRVVGGQRDQYALVEKNLDPRQVHPMPGALPPPLLPNEVVVIRDHGGHVRDARVTEVAGPLFEATYLLKSGGWRSAWFDVLALHPGSRKGDLRPYAGPAADDQRTMNPLIQHPSARRPPPTRAERGPASRPPTSRHYAS